MNKKQASDIVNSDLNAKELKPSNKGNVRFSNKTSAGKNVYWINIRVDDRLSQNIHIILNDNENREFTHLLIPSNTFDTTLFKVRHDSKVGIDKIDLELSYDDDNYLHDIKSSGTNYDFSQYVSKVYKY